MLLLYILLHCITTVNCCIPVNIYLNAPRTLGFRQVRDNKRRVKRFDKVGRNTFVRKRCKIAVVKDIFPADMPGHKFVDVCRAYLYLFITCSLPGYHAPNGEVQHASKLSNSTRATNYLTIYSWLFTEREPPTVKTDLEDNSPSVDELIISALCWIAVYRALWTSHCWRRPAQTQRQQVLWRDYRHNLSIRRVYKNYICVRKAQRHRHNLTNEDSVSPKSKQEAQLLLR